MVKRINYHADDDENWVCQNCLRIFEGPKFAGISDHGITISPNNKSLCDECALDIAKSVSQSFSKRKEQKVVKS